MALVNRGYTPRTTRLLREYLATHYPNATRIAEFHLTKPNPGAIARAGGDVSQRFGGEVMGYPDALVVLPHEVQLWEAKDSLTGAAIGQIEAYAMLWPLSVESAQYAGLPLTLHILAARAGQHYIEMAAAKNIDVVIYAPAWYVSSQAATTAVATERLVAVAAAPIIAKYLSGAVDRLDTVQALISLGISQDSAEARIENASAQHAES